MTPIESGLTHVFFLDNLTMEMAKKKSKKTVYKKPISSRNTKTRQSRVISFFIGVATVAVIAFLISQYAQENNYKTVLGEKTNNSTSR